ncbi:putative membrane protein [Geobacillus kaustophilus]|uniref:Putative membrane protein n=1 Tax=Geobacillus kaustophilus TaxID=1462 RepID=A0A0D8BT72_GEOKU|nr:putative membrane protein [Geobacillus kaustophilus]
MSAYEIHGFFLVFLIYFQLFHIVKTKDTDYVYAIIPTLSGLILVYTSIFDFIDLYMSFLVLVVVSILCIVIFFRLQVKEIKREWRSKKDT